MLEKTAKKWYDKVRCGEEGYEGISYERGRVVHSMERHIAELEVVGVKMWKNGNLVGQEVWNADKENDNPIPLKVVIKRYGELLVTMDLGKSILYFGDNTKYQDGNQYADEIGLYIQGSSGCYLIQGSVGRKIHYLGNIGVGDASLLMSNLFEMLESQKEVKSDEKSGNDSLAYT